MRRLILATVAAAGVLSAQSNTVPGLDGRLQVVDQLAHFGHRGTFPNGEEGCAMLNTLCNPGSVNIPWDAVPQTNHPKFGFIIARESGGRIVQISDRSFCKHAFYAASSPGPCGTCNNVFGNLLGIGCSDTYANFHNASQTDLGPPDEIDPWLGTWNMVGSYFDRGDPDVGSPQNNDGSYSLNPSAFDAVKNRVTIKDGELNQAGNFYYGIQLVHQGEAVANRGDNIKSRGFTASWGGSGWNFANTAVGEAFGSILQRWTGATLSSGGNGTSDGRFFVASKVTPLGGGQFHYEYAVHNVDNSRGAASFRVPIAATATASNFGFRDIDSDALNQWVATRIGNEIVFTAPGNNPQNWNSIFNFWFDTTQSPAQGIVLLDEARIGPGALQVSVSGVDVPSGVLTAFNTTIGNGCAGGSGPCQSSVYEYFATPAAFDLGGSSMGLSFNSVDYHLGAATGTFNATIGTALPLTDDSELPITLPFTLPYPGGSTTQLFVNSNGFVSAGSSPLGFLLDIPGFLSGPATWSPAWHDLNVQQGGSIFWTSSPSVVRVTWSAVPSYGGTDSHTFQLEFLVTGQVNFYWSTMTTSATDYLTGWTPGNGASDPGTANLSALIPAANLVLCAGSQNLQPLTVAAGARPVLGTTVPMTTTNVPLGSPLHALVYSLQQAVPPIDLGTIGMPNCQAHMAAFDFAAQHVNPGSTVVDNLLVPNQPYLVGVTVVLQAISNSPTRNQFGWLSSNAILMFLAAQ